MRHSSCVILVRNAASSKRRYGNFTGGSLETPFRILIEFYRHSLRAVFMATFLKIEKSIAGFALSLLKENTVNYLLLGFNK